MADVEAAVAYYRDVLGFGGEWFWREGGPEARPTFGIVRFGKATVMFSLQPELAAKVEGHQHYFGADDVAKLYARHIAAGARVISPLEKKPWGISEYTVRDITGYHLRFAGHERLSTGSDTLPDYIAIESRKATMDEYAALMDSVGWAKNLQTMKVALERSDLGVVAIDTRDGQTVGMLRAIGDGRQYTIWDVIVRPSHQGQQIGKQMMQRVLSDLKRIAEPGTFIGLFTGYPGFYQTVGFTDGGGMQRPL